MRPADASCERPPTRHGRAPAVVLDESSLISAKMYEFVSQLHRNDRVLVVGDSRQHEAAEAGRPFAQFQEAGLARHHADLEKRLSSAI